MGKSLFDLYPKESFEHIVNQNIWKEYKNYFGEYIDKLFGDNYAVKLRFGQFYAMVIKVQYEQAFRFLKSYKENFISEYDLLFYNQFEELCLNTSEMRKTKINEWGNNYIFKCRLSNPFQRLWR